MNTRVQLTFLVLSAVIGAVLGRYTSSRLTPSESVPQKNMIGCDESSSKKVMGPAKDADHKEEVKVLLGDMAQHWRHTGICPEHPTGKCKAGKEMNEVMMKYRLNKDIKCVQLSVIFRGKEFHACVLTNVNQKQ